MYLRFLFVLTTALGLGAGLAACSGDRKPAADPATAAAAQEAAKPNHARDAHRVDSLEAAIRQAVAKSTNPDVRLTLYTIKAYQYFALDYPQDPRTPDYLNRAGQLYAGVLGDYAHAVEYYERAYTQYPTYKLRPNLLFQEAAAYDAAGDTTASIGTYRRLLAAYPKHPLAQQATDLIRFTRLSPAERQQFFGGRPPAGAAAKK